MARGDEADRLLDALELTEYEAAALGELFSLGRVTAPDLASATDIPNARIYGVLESFAEEGYIKIIAERPKQFQPKPPAAVLDRAVENRRQAFDGQRERIEESREAFLAEFEPRFEGATEEITPTGELFYGVDVGEASERETRGLYTGAAEQVSVVTKSFEYFERVEPVVRNALDRGVDVRVFFLHPDELAEENREVQSVIVGTLGDAYPAIDVRFSVKQLPLRGTIADPSPEYDTGKAVFQVEETDIPLHMRQAAVTENGPLVAAMERYFSLVWEYESGSSGSTVVR